MIIGRKVICECDKVCTVIGDGLHRCDHCRAYYTDNGERLESNQLLPCKECGRVYVSAINLVDTLHGLSVCPDCQTVHDRIGNQVDYDLIVCGECKEYFNGENHSASRGSMKVIDSVYQCPACRTYLDKQGKSMENEKLFSCKACDIKFNEDICHADYGIVTCVQCNETLDYYGNKLASSEVSYCDDCDIHYNKLEYAVCPLCWR